MDATDLSCFALKKEKQVVGGNLPNPVNCNITLKYSLNRYY